MRRIEVMSGPERRRRWSSEQKRAIVAEAFAPGSSVSAVARRVDVVPGQIYRWRQELAGAAVGFGEVVVSPPSCATTAAHAPAIEIELARAASIPNEISPATPGSSRPTPMLASMRFTTMNESRVRSSKLHAGPMRDGSYSSLATSRQRLAARRRG